MVSSSSSGFINLSESSVSSGCSSAVAVVAVVSSESS